MTDLDRRLRAQEADALCTSAYADTVGVVSGVALVAVGGYGRAELAPYSDLDVVLIHDDAVDPGEAAGKIWYPLWDSGATIDHSVRGLTEAAQSAAGDLKVALGLLDARHLAGDPNLTLRLRSSLLTQWRRDARHRLGDLRRLVDSRSDRLGELAHAAVPDLKESIGGLRDATTLKALVATWLVDVPHADLERCRTSLLDVRDALHTVAGRATDRVAPEYWPEMAELLNLPDGVAAQIHTRQLGRRMTHLSRLTWHRVDSVLRRPEGVTVRRPALVPIGRGLALHGDELVLDGKVRPEQDPLLLLRAGAEAAERGVVLAPATAARLARDGRPLPEPWAEDARELLTRLLAAGRGLLGVWETLDETEGLRLFLPEWEHVRLLPHASSIHRFTVDRHMVETCIEASALIRRVARPDVLMVAALLHDIGKGREIEHCEAGEPLARAIATRMGFGEREVDLVAGLVRWHLLLAGTATTRDLDDPATVEHVAGLLADVEMLDLLEVLTEADARATSPQAWTDWRARLVGELAARVRARLVHNELPAVEDAVHAVEISQALREDPDRVDVRVETVGAGSTDGPGSQARVTLVARDRVGLMADQAAALALQRVSVRAARVWTQGEYAVSIWDVDRPDLDAAVLRQVLRRVTTDGAADKLGRAVPSRLEPTVRVRHEISADATGLEVRMDDRPGVVHLVAAALAGLQIVVRSAHVTTIGPQAVDIFYVREYSGGPLTEERAEAAAHAVREALLATVTLDP